MKCENCGISTEFNFGYEGQGILCETCSEINKPDPKQVKIPSNIKKINVQNTKLNSIIIPKALKVFGWVYFIIAFLVGIRLSSSSGGYNDELYKTTENILTSLSIASFLSSFIVLLICLGIARIIEQNIFLLEKH